MDKVFFPPHIFVASSKSEIFIPFRAPSYSAVKKALPDNIQLITFTKLPSEKYETYLIRLGHQYGYGEDQYLSAP
eukprot:4157381-Ditylum_brightwellii.AAC.1